MQYPIQNISDILQLKIKTILFIELVLFDDKFGLLHLVSVL